MLIEDGDVNLLRFGLTDKVKNICCEVATSTLTDDACHRSVMCCARVRMTVDDRSAKDAQKYKGDRKALSECKRGEIFTG